MCIRDSVKGVPASMLRKPRHLPPPNHAMEADARERERAGAGAWGNSRRHLGPEGAGCERNGLSLIHI
eukprot:3037523-Alexandrium_andersonii.AAC.1